jgi:HSP20 family protein
MAESKSSEKEQQRSTTTQSGTAREQDRTQPTRSGLSLQRRHAYQSLFALSPFELMRRMSEEMMGVLGGGRGATVRDQGIWAPRIEAFQDGNEFVVRAELPGLSANDVAVNVGDDALTIHGERRQEHQEQRGGMVVSEISYGEFNRVIPLPEGVIADSAAATFRDGVLEIRMPAPPAEVSRGRRLEIKQESQSQSQARGQSQTGSQSQAAGQTQTGSQSASQSQGSTSQSQGGSQPR